MIEIHSSLLCCLRDTLKPIVKIGLLAALTWACSEKTSDVVTSSDPDSTISVYGPYVVTKLPVSKGVSISNPIQLKLGPDGILYAANQTGEVYSLRDTDNDGLEDMALLYCNVKDLGLRSPSGFTHNGDTIYIGTAQQIRAFLDMNKDGHADTSWVFFDQIPNSEHPYEWTSGLTFGPDGWLYFALSTDSWNAAPSPDPKGYRGSILRISPDGKKVESVAIGIRSVYGLSFNSNGDLFFTDNEGGGNPTEELNKLDRNAFYGHNPDKYTFSTVTPPVLDLKSEVAPSGIEFNKRGNNFGSTEENLLIAFYGPGERWTRGGVARITIQPGNNGQYSYNEVPIADIPKLSSLAFGKDGALYLAHHGKADYWYNVVYKNQGGFYKLVYDSSLLAQPAKARAVRSDSFSTNTIEAGKQLFAEQACLGCHAVDGTTELLGPNLKDVGNRLTREEILEEILEPSKRIKPSMMAVRLTKKDGDVLIGRVINSKEEKLLLMLVGNHTVEVNRMDIAKIEDEKRSLMYEGLLNDLNDKQKQALLDFIISLKD
jgi:putative heme-binding domain-containing protein